MENYIIAFCFLIALFSSLKEKNIYNPLTIFYLLWAIIVLLASMHLEGLNRVSQKTYLVVAIGLLGFFIGYVLISIVLFNKKRKIESTKNIENKYVLRYRVLYILYFITIIYLSYRAFQAIQLFSLGYLLSDMRGSFSSVVLGSKWNLAYENYINGALVLLCIPIASVDFFAGKKDKNLLILSLIIIILSSIASGGRVIFYYFIINFTIAMLIYKKHLKIDRKTKRTIIMLVIIGTAAIYLLSSMRGITTTFTSQLYLYLAGCIPHLDYRIQLIDQSQMYTYGWTFFSGYLKPFFYFLNTIGLCPYPHGYLNSLALSNVDNFVKIGYRLYYNSFVTPFFYFYLDGGMIGVFLCSGIYGSICATSYFYVKKLRNMRNTVFYLLIMQGILTSMVRWQFSISAYALSFIYLIFIFKKCKVIDNAYKLVGNKLLENKK